jgi:hypothetical protein
LVASGAHRLVLTTPEVGLFLWQHDAEEEESMTHYNIGSDALAPVWFIGWLFTIGFVRLTFWKGLLALVIWPFYLGKWLYKPPQ